MSISGTIKSIQDTMREDVGVDGDVQRLGQLVWMLFLKVVDDRENELATLALLEGQTFKSPIPEKFRWRNWAANDEGMTGDELKDFIDNQLFPALQNLAVENDDPRTRVVQNVFADAYNQNAVLFFDEADTLLGKRLSSVTQGVDNEVNAMRSTMLIELEKFDGIVIFATNFAKNYDEAFRSRIGYHVEFTLPDLEARTRLWQKMLVAKIPLAEDRAELIQQCAGYSEDFSGREIRTCMRLALPKVLIEAESLVQQPKLAFSHLQSAMDSVRKSQKEVGSNVDSSVNRQRAVAEANLARNILGVKSSEASEGIKLQESVVS